MILINNKGKDSRRSWPNVKVDTSIVNTRRMDPESYEMGAKNKAEYEKYFDSQKLSTLIKTGDHKQIIKWVKMKKLSLQSLDRQTSSRTLMSQILEEVANGHLIVNEILNTYVTPTNPSLNPNSNDFSVDLDFAGITHQREDETGAQESAVTDLVRLVLEHKGNLWSRNFSHALDFIMPDACLTWQKSIRPNQKVVFRTKGTHILNFNQIKPIDFTPRADVPPCHGLLHYCEMEENSHLFCLPHPPPPFLSPQLLFLHQMHF